MSRQLKVIRIDGEQPEIVGVLAAGEIKIGREPGADGITVNSNGVSREHGMFVRCRNHWLYRDFGSTNGSWIGGRAIKGDHWGVVRKGSVLQLADTGFTFEDEGEDDNRTQPQSLTNFPALGGRSILVFKRGEFVEEFPVPEYGKAVVVGGRDADLAFGADSSDRPSLVIERRGDDVVCYQVAKEFNVTINSEIVDGTQNLKDGDELELEEYWLIFNDPQAKQQAINASTGQEFLNFRGWGEPRDEDTVTVKPVATQIFGAGSFGNANAGTLEEEEYVSPGSGLFGTRGTGTFGAGYTEPVGGEKNMSQLEDRIIIGIGLAVVFALFMLVIWWLIT